MGTEFCNSLTAAGPASAIAAFRASTFALGDGMGWGPSKARRVTAMFATYGVAGFDLVSEISSDYPDITFGIASVAGATRFAEARVFVAGEEVAEHRLDGAAFDREAPESNFTEVELIDELEAAIASSMPGRASRAARI